MLVWHVDRPPWQILPFSGYRQRGQLHATATTQKKSLDILAAIYTADGLLNAASFFDDK